MHAVNAGTGSPLWKAITGTPKLKAGRPYVPVSGGEEEVAAGSPDFVRCKFRGSLTLARIWISARHPCLSLPSSLGWPTWMPRSTGSLDVNGVKAHGGAIDGAGTTIAGGMVYANAGYSRFPVMAGNVLLAFSVDGK
jgi:hypothetical protein